MIAMKREVAATSKDGAGFPWSECQEKLTTSHCTDSLHKAETRVLSVKDLKKRETAFYF